MTFKAKDTKNKNVVISKIQMTKHKIQNKSKISNPKNKTFICVLNFVICAYFVL